MSNKTLRNTFISIFVVLWLGVFHYESLRHFYLQPLAGKPLPKVKFLFPPAGWIMFYNVDDQFGFSEVYGVKGTQIDRIDPHDIFRTRTIGFDNIHRGILGTAARAELAQPFCRFLKYRFPYYDKFVVRTTYYPALTKEPHTKFEKIMYQCVNDSPVR